MWTSMHFYFDKEKVLHWGPSDRERVFKAFKDNVTCTGPLSANAESMWKIFTNEKISTITHLKIEGYNLSTSSGWPYHLTHLKNGRASYIFLYFLSWPHGDVVSWSIKNIMGRNRPDVMLSLCLLDLGEVKMTKDIMLSQGHLWSENQQTI